MIDPRWRKVFADLWANKTRTMLTILTVMVGVFAVGLLAGISAIMLADMDVDYQAANPHAAILYTDLFDDAYLQTARHVPGVADAQGRSSVSGRVLIDAETKTVITINAVDPDDLHIDQLRFVDPGERPVLKDHEVWIETSALSLLPVKVGDTIRFETPNRRIRELRVSGIVRDVSYPSSNFTGQAFGFVNADTIEWLGGTSAFQQLLFTVAENRTDQTHVEAVAQAISDRFAKGGLKVYATEIYNPGRHFSYEIFIGIVAILNVLGAAIVLLSIFLVVNTMNALIGQHVRQIGIMKAIGGQNYQLMAMYLVLIASFGVLALLIAAPLGAIAAYATCSWMSGFVNLQLQGFRVAPVAIVAQVLTALGVPLAAGLVPVINGVRITIREALSTYGIDAGQSSAQPSFIYRVFSRFLSRPGIISLQNTFRRVGRLAMILTILTLGGAVFISVFNLWTTFDVVMRDLQGYFLADINVAFSHPYNLSKVDRIARSLPEVTGVEGWAASMGELSGAGDTQTQVVFLAPPSDSKLINPVITAGRWFTAEDTNAVVIGNHLLKLRPELKVGDDLTIKVNERRTTWHIVGFYQLSGNTNPPILYTSREVLTKVLNNASTASSLRILIEPNGPESEQRVSRQLEGLFEQAGVQVTNMQTATQWRASQSSTLNVVIYFLLVMALLIALVGGLGLMSTMSMNVLERTREIGIMRAIGASNGSILWLVLVEGLVIGLISWVLAVALSFPITLLLNTGVGVALFSMPLKFAFGWNGMAIWLAGILVLAGMASLLPALRAVRLTVRDVLAYE